MDCGFRKSPSAFKINNIVTLFHGWIPGSTEFLRITGCPTSMTHDHARDCVLLFETTVSKEWIAVARNPFARP